MFYIYFGFSFELNEEAKSKLSVLDSLDQKAKVFFKKKEYGTGIQSLVITFTCVAPSFDFFFKPLKKYLKTKKLLEYGIKFNYDNFTNATEKETKEMIAKEVLNSLSIIKEFKIKDFDLDKFRSDIVLFFNQKTNEPLLVKQQSKTESSSPHLNQQSDKPVNKCCMPEFRKSCLIRLLNEKKYLPDGFVYTGALTELLRNRFEKELNDFIQRLINEDDNVKTNEQLLEVMRQFLYSSSLSDTEDREYLANYMEKILEAYCIGSSDGLLNEWMYGLNPKE